jgi:hypothetical protein
MARKRIQENMAKVRKTLEDTRYAKRWLTDVLRRRIDPDAKKTATKYFSVRHQLHQRRHNLAMRLVRERETKQREAAQAPDATSAPAVAPAATPAPAVAPAATPTVAPTAPAAGEWDPVWDPFAATPGNAASTPAATPWDPFADGAVPATVHGVEVLQPQRFEPAGPVSFEPTNGHSVTFLAVPDSPDDYNPFTVPFPDADAAPAGAPTLPSAADLYG